MSLFTYSTSFLTTRFANKLRCGTRLFAAGDSPTVFRPNIRNITPSKFRESQEADILAGEDREVLHALLSFFSLGSLPCCSLDSPAMRSRLQANLLSARALPASQKASPNVGNGLLGLHERANRIRLAVLSSDELREPGPGPLNMASQAPGLSSAPGHVDAAFVSLNLDQLGYAVVYRTKPESDTSALEALREEKAGSASRKEDLNSAVQLIRSVGRRRY
ncbi:hypothetical protein C8J56DRAFT_1159908 [Mycena floridula]|nr:hypothetical protein C8J56DRAFT_1159908 [Mycena floridula]